MLHQRSHSRNAFEQSPERERRLCAFSDNSGTADQQPREQQPEDRQANTESNTSPIPSGNGPDPTIDQTRRQTADTLNEDAQNQQDESGEHTKLTTYGLIEKLNEIKQRILTSQQRARSLYENHKDIIPANIQKKIRESDRFLLLQIAPINRWIETVQEIHNFESGQSSTEQFANFLTTFIQDTGIEGPDDDLWKAKLQSLKDAIQNQNDENPMTIENVKAIIPFDDLLKLIKQNCTALEDPIIQNALLDMDETLKNIEDTYAKTREEQTTPTESEGFFESIGIEFYTPMEIWEAFKMVKEAYTESFRQRTRLKASGLAQSAGNIMQFFPFVGGDIRQVLDSQLDKASNEIKDGYVSYLKNKYTSFDELFAAGGELDRNKKNSNLARAVIEYAASRGWLWDINEASEQTMIVAGRPLNQFLPKHWNNQQRTQYFRFLVGENNNGQQKERENGKSRVSTAENIEVIIPAMIQEMRGKNFWAMLGMAEQAMTIGKLGEVSAWITTTIFTEMRRGDTLKYIPKNLIDQLGGLGLGHPGFTPQFFKTEKPKIYEWRQKKKIGIDTPMETAGELAKVISMIEQDVSDVEEGARTRLIAKILAGQLVEHNGKQLSIFNSKYNSYRREIVMRQPYVGIPNMQADADFFAEESEIIMYGPTALKEILNNSNEVITHKDKAINFLRNIINRYDALVKAGAKEAAKEFKLDMQEKFGDYMTSGTINGARSMTWTGQRVLTKKSKNEGIVKGELAFAGLLRRDLIKKEDLESLIRDESNPGTKSGVFQKILGQVDPTNPLLNRP